MTASVSSLADAQQINDKDADQLIKGYGYLEKAMIQAGEDHIVTPLPESKPDSTDAYATSRFSVIVNRLYMLGYLQNDSVPDQLDDTYQQAVKAFQQDAFGEVRLKPDGWVGEKTWSALQEMVSFEEPSNLEKWFKGVEPCKALRRAALLRLYALGLTSRAPGHLRRGKDIQSRIDKLYQKGLAEFSKVTKLLGWPEAETLISPAFKTLNLLFNQDGIVSRLAKAKVPKSLESRKKIKPFIVGMVRIELWLIGYDISPKGYAGASDLMTHDNGLDLKDSSKLYKQLLLYWHDYEQDETNLFQKLIVNYPKLKSQSIANRSTGLIRIGFPGFFGSVFQRLASASQEDVTDSESVYEQLREVAGDKDHKGSIIQEIWNHVYSIGARIWDGIKRAWQWVKSLVVKVFKGVKQFIKNISRIAYQFILKAYEQTRRLIKGVTGSIHFFLRTPLELPKLREAPKDPKVLFLHDRDFDFQVFVETSERPNVVRLHSQYVKREAQIFGLSCHIVGECLHHLIKMLKGIWGLAWAALLMALLKTYQSIKKWAPDIIALEKQQQSMRAPVKAALAV